MTSVKLVASDSIARRKRTATRSYCFSNGQKVGFYRADFRYKEVTTGTVITEDVKSSVTKTAVYQLKKKLMKALYGIEVVEV